MLAEPFCARPSVSESSTANFFHLPKYPTGAPLPMLAVISKPNFQPIVTLEVETNQPAAAVDSHFRLDPPNSTLYVTVPLTDQLRRRCRSCHILFHPTQNLFT